MAAIKLKWIISFIHSRSIYNWQCILSFYLNQYGKNVLIFNMNISTLKQLPMVKHKLPLFYQDLLQHWSSFKNLHRKMPHIFREIRMQVLWGNQFIKLSGQNKTYFLQLDWVRNYFLNDILDVNGKISHNKVLPKLLKKQNWIAELTSIKNAIPSACKSTITNRESILSKVKTILTPLDDRLLNSRTNICTGTC